MPTLLLPISSGALCHPESPSPEPGELWLPPGQRLARVEPHSAPGPASAHLAKVTYSWKTKLLSHLVLIPCHSPVPLGTPGTFWKCLSSHFWIFFFKHRVRRGQLIHFFFFSGEEKVSDSGMESEGDFFSFVDL